MTDFLFLVSKITADGDCSHEIRRLFLGRKAMTNLDSVLKSRDVTLPTKYHIVKAMILLFKMLIFKPAFSLSSSTFIKRFFSSSSFSSIRVVSSASLRSLIFLPAILIPAGCSSSLSFHKIHSAYKLNK